VGVFRVRHEDPVVAGQPEQFDAFSAFFLRESQPLRREPLRRLPLVTSGFPDPADDERHTAGHDGSDGADDGQG